MRGKRVWVLLITDFSGISTVLREYWNQRLCQQVNFSQPFGDNFDLELIYRLL